VCVRHIHDNLRCINTHKHTNTYTNTHSHTLHTTHKTRTHKTRTHKTRTHTHTQLHTTHKMQPGLRFAFREIRGIFFFVTGKSPAVGLTTPSPAPALPTAAAPATTHVTPADWRAKEKINIDGKCHLHTPQNQSRNIRNDMSATSAAAAAYICIRSRLTRTLMY
jgi:hypothetical protein